uniref:Uncharacterized protein n=1 Tax=Triticum urartu TaxID=4572 RepID=A0A8R7V9I8_TRIUA
MVWGCFGFQFTAADAPFFCLFQLDSFGLFGIRTCSRRFAFGRCRV